MCHEYHMLLCTVGLKCFPVTVFPPEAYREIITCCGVTLGSFKNPEFLWVMVCGPTSKPENLPLNQVPFNTAQFPSLMKKWLTLWYFLSIQLQSFFQYLDPLFFWYTFQISSFRTQHVSQVAHALCCSWLGRFPSCSIPSWSLQKNNYVFRCYSWVL